jgi:alpha-1,3/alpha-1,6-mannosyltransferase
MVLSINRFERKKNIELAIESFKCLEQESVFKELRLVIAGGYDERVRENVEYLQELIKLCDEMDLKHAVLSEIDCIASDVQVVFIPSFSENQRNFLLKSSSCLLYTPSNEHFGIVPLEAMYSRLPVVAVNSGDYLILIVGGPLESIIDRYTGYVCNPDKESFAKCLSILLNKSNKKMGDAARKHVESKFSVNVFTENLEKIIFESMKNQNEDAKFVSQVSRQVIWLGVIFLAALYLGILPKLASAFFQR